MDFLQDIEWQSVATGTITFVLLIILRAILDFRLAPSLVRWLNRLPLRNYFRERPPKLNGTWDLLWGHGGSEDFSDVLKRHGQLQLWQFASYCYGEFFSDGKKYALFGRIENIYLLGDWYAKKDRLGYFGAFQLEVVDSNRLRGKWIGHSKKTREVRADVFDINRINC